MEVQTNILNKSGSILNRIRREGGVHGMCQSFFQINFNPGFTRRGSINYLNNSKNVNKILFLKRFILFPVVELGDSKRIEKSKSIYKVIVTVLFRSLILSRINSVTME